MAEAFKGVFPDEVVSLIRRFNSHPVADIIKNIEDVYADEIKNKYKTYNEFSIAYRNHNIYRLSEVIEYEKKYNNVPAKNFYNRKRLIESIANNAAEERAYRSHFYSYIANEGLTLSNPSNTSSYITVPYSENNNMNYKEVKHIEDDYRKNTIYHDNINEIEEIEKLQNRLIFSDEDEDKDYINEKINDLKYNILTSKKKLLLWMGFYLKDVKNLTNKKTLRVDLRYILLKQYLDYNLKYYQFITPRKKYNNPHMNYIYNYPKKKLIREEKAPNAYKSITNEYFD